MGAAGRTWTRMRPIAVLCWPYRWWLFAGITAGLLAHISTIAGAFVGAYLIGEALTGTEVSELLPLVWLLVALVLPLVVLGIVENYVVHVLGFRLLYDIRLRMYDRLEEVAPAYLLSRRSGDIANTATADIELLEMFTSHLLPPFLTALVIPTGALVGLFLIDPVLGLVMAPFVAAVASVPSWLLARAEEQGDEIRERLGDLSGDVVDLAQGLREVVMFGGQSHALTRLSREHEALARVQQAHGFRSGFEKGVTDLLIAAALVAVVAAAAALVAAGNLDAALFPAAVVLASACFDPLIQVTGLGREVNQVAAAAERVTGVLEAAPAVRDLVSEPPAGPIDSSIAFEEVTFRYEPNLPPALSGVSFDVGAGEVVALAGHSGSGKSSCVNLLLRMWDPETGRITLGGHDLRAFPQAILRDRIAYVPQDVYLFHTTVRDNIRLAKEGATDDELRAAAATAQALEFIEALPRGWDTPLGERGAGLSGGQRQRIAIARALLKDAPIIVMDEAVSNLDTESEAALQRAMREIRVDRTVLLIAHRPSTIRAADRVVVLEDGRVAEVGAYDDLLGRGGALTRLLRDMDRTDGRDGARDDPLPAE
jgi:thiol reductant ABC exporter CydC subunit